MRKKTTFRITYVFSIDSRNCSTFFFKYAITVQLQYLRYRQFCNEINFLFNYFQFFQNFLSTFLLMITENFKNFIRNVNMELLFCTYSIFFLSYGLRAGGESASNIKIIDMNFLRLTESTNKV